YAATNVEVFLGAGPYRLDDANHTVNPNAVGLVLSNASIGAAKFADGSFAIYATGSASLVGIPGLTLSAQTVTVKINTSGNAVTDCIKLTGGTDTCNGSPGVDMGKQFPTGIFIERASVSGLTIDAAGIFTITGDVTFNEKASGEITVDIPIATVTISMPIGGQLTQAFQLKGHAKF